MQIVRFDEVSPMVFDTRVTRVFAGAGSSIQPQYFSSGIVRIQPGGSVPTHGHEQEEIYYILNGTVEITVGTETQTVQGIAMVYLPSGQPHRLVNVSDATVQMLFVYAPAGVVSHWQEEKDGTLHG